MEDEYFDPADISDKNQKEKRWLEGHVYLLDYGDGKTFKIGHTTKEPSERLIQIEKGTGVIMPMHLVLSARTWTNCRYLENLLHLRFDDVHVRGEWFTLEFPELMELYIILSMFGGSVELYDRWYEVIPENAEEWAEHLLFKTDLPIFDKYKMDHIFDDLFTLVAKS